MTTVALLIPHTEFSRALFFSKDKILVRYIVDTIEISTTSSLSKQTLSDPCLGVFLC